MKVNIYFYLLVTIIIFVSYFTLEEKSYRASWRVHLVGILSPLLLLISQTINPYAALFIYSIFLWHFVDLINVIYKNKLSTIA
jgi:Ca2+/Na+ antiporter